ncbi:MAG: hypothetical protein O2794_01835 [bacterium]|nr:hypothetical protein [bacterium]
MEEEINQILEDTAEAHHEAFKKQNGEDPEWPSWYAQYLLIKTRFPDLVSIVPDEEELANVLKELDQDEHKGYWQSHYTKELLKRYRS